MDTKSIATQFTLGKHERLKSRKLIGQLFDSGKSVTAHPLKVLYAVAPGPSSLQAGFTVSARHFKKAVDRNRLKRLMREAYRRQKQQLNKDNASVILFFIYTGKEKIDFQTAVEKMNMVINKIADLIK